MNKYEFLAELRKRLGSLPNEDIDRSLDYYREMVEDRMEDGLTEEQAVDALGSIDDIVAQIFADSAPVEYKAETKKGSQKNDNVPPKNVPNASESERKTKKALSTIGLIAWICVSIAFWCWQSAVYSPRACVRSPQSALLSARSSSLVWVRSHSSCSSSVAPRSLQASVQYSGSASEWL